MADHWAPTTGTYAVDTTNGRIGEVRKLFESSAYLVPPGGGAEWTVAPSALRSPTDAETWRAQVWTHPVGKAQR
ncbi:hypothetical protein AB0G73_37950 [Streptomyces sp. NPDC020719]|uniref:hypothetical protein n=1 Tax=Streptomyces sp. NPDC020719 TaxID=3154896 RepID=UPI0033D12C5E